MKIMFTMKLIKKLASAIAAGLMLCGCVEKDEEIQNALDIKVTSGEYAYVGIGENAAQIQFKVTPANVLDLKDAEIVLVDTKGQVSEECTIADMHSEGDGVWNADVKFLSSGITSADFILELRYKGVFVKSRQVSMKQLILKIDGIGAKGAISEIDEENSTITLTIPALTDFSSVILDVKSSCEQILVDGTAIESGKTAVNLTKPVKLTAKTGKYTKDYTLTARNTGLPVVRIQTPNGRAITSKEIWMEGSSMRIEQPDGTVDYEGPMSIRGRGNSTWGYPKKPYAIKLDKKSKILGMPKHKRWVLLANWKDRTLIRNAAAFWVSSHTGMPYTVRGTFVEVELNGEHQGNYYLCEQIKIDENRLDITEMDAYETDPEKITGGYLMEVDTYYDEVNKFRSPRFNLPYMFNTPDEESLSKEAFNYMKNYVSELEDILKDEARVRNHEYQAYLDMDSAIDYMFILELCDNHDFYNEWHNGTHSCYMYKDRGGKLCYGPVWDFDYRTFIPLNEISLNIQSKWIGATRTLYYPALYKDPEFRERMYERWDQQKEALRQLPAFIDEMAEKIRLSESVNHELWPIENWWENGDENMSFQQAVDRMKKGYTEKLEWMDKHLKELR